MRAALTIVTTHHYALAISPAACLPAFSLLNLLAIHPSIMRHILHHHALYYVLYASPTTQVDLI